MDQPIHNVSSSQLICPEPHAILINLLPLVLARARLERQSMEINLLVVQSLQFVITQFFLKSSPSFVITISCRHAHTFNFYKLIVEHLFRSMNAGAAMVIQLVLIQQGRPEFVAGSRYYNLYLVDSLQAFLDADPSRYASAYNTNEFYYIFLQQSDEALPQDLQGVLDYCWQHHLINCNVQTQNARGQVLVYTYFPFAEHACGRVQTTLINEFVGSSMLHGVIFPPKLMNLHRCTMRIATWHIPPFMKLKGGINVGGFEGNLLLELARHLNFTIELVPLLNGSNLNALEHQFIIADFIEDALKKLKERTADLSLGYIRQSSERNQVVTSLFAHYQVQQVLCVLQNARNYTSLEILGFPFQRHTWCTLLLMVVIVLIGLRLRSSNTTTLVNFLASTMGLPSTRIPCRHYQRIFHFNWSLASFILRSLYSALLYNLFCTNLYRQPPNTIDELISENYSIVMNRDVYEGVSAIPQFSQQLHNNPQRLRMQIINSIDEAVAFAHIEAEHSATAAMASKEILLYYGRAHGKPGRFHMLPEVVVNQQLTIYLSQHSYLIGQLNDCLQWMHAVGLMDSWVRSELNMHYFRSRHLEGQKFIGQKELNGIYGIWAALMCVAFVVFLLEVFVGKRQICLVTTVLVQNQ